MCERDGRRRSRETLNRADWDGESRRERARTIERQRKSETDGERMIDRPYGCERESLRRGGVGWSGRAFGHGGRDEGRESETPVGSSYSFATLLSHTRARKTSQQIINNQHGRCAPLLLGWMDRTMTIVAAAPPPSINTIAPSTHRC